MNNEKFENNTLLYKVLVHMSVCIFILIMPVLLSLHNNFRFIGILEHSWIPTFFYFIIFYVNYIVLVDKVFLSKKKLLQSLLKIRQFDPISLNRRHIYFFFE